MDESFLPDASTPFGQRARSRLRDAPVAWLTTVGADGTPQPNPIWFLWEGASVLVYSRPDAHRLAHVRRRPRISLNLDGNGQGGDVIVLTGTAELPESEPLPHQAAEYVAKYRHRMLRVAGSLETFSEQYPVAMRIAGLRLRGW